MQKKKTKKNISILNGSNFFDRFEFELSGVIGF